jgi:hypothetical protein
MTTFSRLPMDVVMKILSYDRRYVIRNGKIIEIKKLDQERYEEIVDLLLAKPQMRFSCIDRDWMKAWEFMSTVKLGKCYEISYDCIGPKDIITYCFTKKVNGKETYATHIFMK